jgi:hypothetical protein
MEIIGTDNENRFVGRGRRIKASFISCLLKQSQENSTRQEDIWLLNITERNATITNKVG